VKADAKTSPKIETKAEAAKPTLKPAPSIKKLAE
jgi:hypothetical protein